jgi:hypothetical protein
MYGRCAGCKRVFPHQRLAGYDVRAGKITRAICPSCLRYYENVLDLRGGWFERVIRKIKVNEKRLAKAGVKNLPNETWQQTTIDGL